MKGAIVCVLLFMMVFALISCNAPHTNPLDPFSLKQNYATISGVVQDSTPPFPGIADVSVYWVRQKTMVKTDSTGSFEMTNVIPVDGNLILEKDGYQPDTVVVTWANTLTFSDTMRLSKIP